ncbi:LysM peptidoglycan-binding domain-containing protein [Paraburkholderia sediminicola]|uniref:LysM peptidoglycan-binding domain-containing protein n=1 Tax=Paraburkholderia sediminicola TaxID=458836 RepID=UPI0038BD6473
MKILVPLQKPVWEPGSDVKSYIRSLADTNGWDVLPLFQGESRWLRSYPIFEESAGGPCAWPSSPDPSADDFDDIHECATTCSNTVQVGGQCWLNGTVNYGTYGIMVRLCRDEFPIQFRFALETAMGLIRMYKTVGAHPEDSTLPIAWLQATFNGGPSAKPPNPSNRPQCNCSCPKRGSVTTWDYVWEPVKPRNHASPPAIPVKPVTPPTAPGPAVPTPALKSYSVMPGDTLSKIAQKVYGDPSRWQLIYQANKALIGSNPNLIRPGQKLTIP